MSCTLFINHDDGYTAGDVIIGNFQINLNSDKNIRGVTIKLEGVEQTSWTEHKSYYDFQSKKRRSRIVHCRGRNILCSEQLMVTGEGTLHRGTHEYPFTFTIPNSSPGTFKNAYGYIKYYLKANVDIVLGFDYDAEREITVKAPIDFNLLPDLPLALVQYQDEKIVCCCCCRSGPITMDVYLEKQAFVVGEIVPITVNVGNMSNLNIESLNARITMTIKSKTTSPRESREDTELIAAVYDTGVGAHGARTYNLSLEIPSDSGIPNFNLSTLFEKWFKLKVEAVLPSCHQNLEIWTSVIIGHIPRYIQTASCSVSKSPSKQPPPYEIETSISNIGFNVPGVIPVPVHSPSPNAPPDISAPSAPPKLESKEGFEYTDDEGPPPPSYSDAMGSENSSTKRV